MRTRVKVIKIRRSRHGANRIRTNLVTRLLIQIKPVTKKVSELFVSDSDKIWSSCQMQNLQKCHSLHKTDTLLLHKVVEV